MQPGFPSNQSFVNRDGKHRGESCTFPSLSGSGATFGDANPKRRYVKNEALCPSCEGKGRVTDQTLSARGRKGGNVAYLKSLEPGGMSMVERGRRGGRPRALTLMDLGGREPSS